MDEFPPQPAFPGRQALFRILLRLTVIVAGALLLVYAMDWAMARAEALAEEIGTGMMIGAIIFFLVVYALLISVPFVPGIEIGIALLVMRGEAVAPFVYLATVTGILIAYAVGSTVSYRWLHRFFADLGLVRACELTLRVGALSGEERLDHLKERLPAWLRGVAVSGRYVTLACLLNLPGNGILGGGGGIAMVAGLSRVFAPLPMVVTVALAVLPVPLAVWLWGGGALAAE
ncbi:MAG: hypothetical protein AAF871_08735 [Pseudomonadota bacterium]